MYLLPRYSGKGVNYLFRSLPREKVTEKADDKDAASNEKTNSPNRSSSSSSLTEDEYVPGMLIVEWNREEEDSPQDKKKRGFFFRKREDGSRRSLWKEISRRGSRLMERVGNVWEDMLFEDASIVSSSTAASTTRRTYGMRLFGCETDEEHFEKHDAILNDIALLYGQEGLRAAGLCYRLVPCPLHATQQDFNQEEIELQDENDENNEKNEKNEHVETHDHYDSVTSQKEREDDENGESHQDENEPQHVEVNGDASIPQPECLCSSSCDDCLLRLTHCETGTVVNHENRKRFVADGFMYDEIARCCMDVAHDLMMREGGMEWMVIDDDVRALVSTTFHERRRPVLLLVTGKGKVRAGIFSRQHLLSTSLDVSTALGVVREAKRRDMDVVLLDPNARGERAAMDTITLCMTKLDLLHQPLFVQAHSVGGSHMVRYFMDHFDVYANHVRAMTFTDSTHNIQWLTNSQNKGSPSCALLHETLQSPKCVYFRSTNLNRDDELHQTGHVVETNEHWCYRFGGIQTLWAGTTEHSLTDWYSRSLIWDHFDRHT